MEVTDTLVEHLAKLSRLRFDSEEKQAIKGDLQKMISFVEKLQELDLQDVAPLMHMTSNVNILREDIVAGSLNKSAALQNAPMADEDYIKVPKVINK